MRGGRARRCCVPLRGAVHKDSFSWLSTGAWNSWAGFRCPWCWIFYWLLHWRFSPQIGVELPWIEGEDISISRRIIDIFCLQLATILTLFFIAFFLGVIIVINRWRDLKMAMHGLTLRKAKADLFDYLFVTVKLALSDWRLPPSISTRASRTSNHFLFRLKLIIWINIWTICSFILHLHLLQYHWS